MALRLTSRSRSAVERQSAAVAFVPALHEPGGPSAEIGDALAGAGMHDDLLPLPKDAALPRALCMRTRPHLRATHRCAHALRDPLRRTTFFALLRQTAACGGGGLAR